MKLISMTDFVLQEKTGGQQVNPITSQLYYELRIIKKYADFLKQPLKLEMFVSCDDNGNVLEDIIGNGMIYNYSEKVTQYEQAKEKVLFEDFEIATNKEGEKLILGDYTCLKVSDLENGTIEDLTKYVTIKLTNQAIDRNFGQACYIRCYLLVRLINEKFKLKY